MNDPRELITETYEGLKMEEVMNFRFDDDYEAFADHMFAEQEDLYLTEPDDGEWDPEDDDEEECEDYTDEGWCD